MPKPKSWELKPPSFFFSHSPFTLICVNSWLIFLCALVSQYPTFFLCWRLISASQARHHHIVRKKPVLQAQKDIFTNLLQNTIASRLFALTAPLPTDIMVLASEVMAFAGWVMLRGSPLRGSLNNLGWKVSRGFEFQKEGTMKNSFVWTILGVACLCVSRRKSRQQVGGAKRTSFLLLAVLLCILVFWLGGCSLIEQPGETAAEGNRRHLRNLTVNQQNMMSDIDRTLLFDKPSKLTDKKIP
jgi:hypothetical protein